MGIVADTLQNQGKYTAYGKHVAEELQELPTKMAIYCKRMINEAIFQAQLGNLTENSKIITMDNSVLQTNYNTQNYDSQRNVSANSTGPGPIAQYFSEYSYEDI